jgi:predicted nucleotidyltransferase
MQKELPAQIQSILKETYHELKSLYSDHLKEMILFGSYARGDFMNESDIDLMLLLDNMNDVASEGDKYRSMISRISLKYDTVVSIVPFHFEEFQQKRTPLILNVKNEGIKM